MNEYRVTFNFTTGDYDLIRLEDMTVLSSHAVFLDARDEMDKLSNNPKSPV